MKTYNCIYDKVLTTDSKRFTNKEKALMFFAKKLCKFQVFILQESEWINGERVTKSNKYKIYDGVPELIY